MIKLKLIYAITFKKWSCNMESNIEKGGSDDIGFFIRENKQKIIIYMQSQFSHVNSILLQITLLYRFAPR